MSDFLAQYGRVAGPWAMDQLRQLAEPLAGRKIVHVNSTRVGGGVAEILEKLVPLTRELGIDVSWEVIEGDEDFYRCTKSFHNGLQGEPVQISDRLLRGYERTNEANAAALRGTLVDADVVFIHDPQPAALLSHFPDRRGVWVWRCHIDLSQPNLAVWRYLQEFVKPYDSSIFSLAGFARPLPHPQYIIQPSIDPLSEKNMDLPEDEVDAVRREFGLDRNRPLAVQVSRFDRFKDPVGVIRAYRIAKRFFPDLQLVLAGGTATDDPEGEEILAEVRRAGGDDPDLHILLLPPDSHRMINALQRASDIIVQKSLREGFGLTVTEGMWKGKPVIGGNAGGIRLQVKHGHTGFLVNTPEGAAMRIRQLVHHSDLRRAMGRRGREFARESFLLTRLLREHLTVIHALLRETEERIDLTVPWEAAS